MLKIDQKRIIVTKGQLCQCRAELWTLTEGWLKKMCVSKKNSSVFVCVRVGVRELASVNEYVCVCYCANLCQCGAEL